MKDIYELLNEVNIDENEFEEIEVTEFEKAKVKSALKKSVIKKKRKMSWKMNVLAAVLVLGLSVTTIGIAFPTYAGNLPIIGDVFRFLDNEKTGIYDNYKEFSTEMNLTEESNGIKMTINDAVFDGNTVSITYTIESEIDLSGTIRMLPDSTPILGARGMIESSELSKVDDYHYVGLSRFTPSELTLNSEKAISVKWNINSFILHEIDKVVKGKWKFAFSLKATDNKVQLSHESAQRNGVQVTVEKLTFTPMSFIVHYNQKVTEQVGEKQKDIEVELEVRDDLGKIYSGVGNGGFGKDTITMGWSKTFEKLDPRATKLIVTPTITALSYDTNALEGEGGEERTENGVTITTAQTNPVSNFTSEEFILEDIVIELEK